VTPAVLWQLLDALGDGLALTGEDGRITLVNRRCAEMFGYRREEMTGLPVDELVPAEVRATHSDYRAGYYRAPQARPSRASSLKPRVVNAANAEAPSLRPSTMPAAIASTFFAAPPISTPRISDV